MLNEKKEIFGVIHSYETLGATDGPGLRFILFTQGCHLRCKYCHNPDTQRTCRLENAAKNGFKVVSASEIASEALKYKNYYGRRGGITASGGEPLLQIEFLTALFKIMKENGVNTAIDTSGLEYSEKDENLGELLRLTDLILLDVKHIDSEKCKVLTGRGNENFFKFARRLESEKIPVWIRQVLVPGYTDDETDLIKTREFIQSLNNVEKVEILPYHTLGKSKYEKLGIPYPLENVKSPTAEEVARAKKLLGVI